MILMATTLAQAFQQTPWVKVTPVGGRFSVMMPTKPEESTETRDSPLGEYTAHLFMARGGEAIYIVGWVDYAPSVKLDVQGEIDANRDNFLKGVSAKMTGERKITLDGNPGIEFTAESEGNTFKSRIYLAHNRPYMLATTWIKGDPEPAGISTFLNSFKFENPARGGN